MYVYVCIYIYIYIYRPMDAAPCGGVGTGAVISLKSDTMQECT